MKACGCPETYPDWHGRDVDLGGWCVHALPIPMLLHMPLAYFVYAKRQQSAIDHLELREPWPGFTMTLTGVWRGRIMRLLETTESPARHIEFLSRPFHLRGYLHRGSVSNIRLPVHDMAMNLLSEGRRAKELYLSYLTCPQCRGADEPDKILLLRRWVESPTLERRTRKERATEKRDWATGRSVTAPAKARYGESKRAGKDLFRPAWAGAPAAESADSPHCRPVGSARSAPHAGGRSP